MHTQRNRIFFFGSTALTGLASLGLHRYMMENCFDHKGLLLAGNLPGTLLWVLGIGYVAALIAMLTTLGGVVMNKNLMMIFLVASMTGVFYFGRELKVIAKGQILFSVVKALLCLGMAGAFIVMHQGLWDVMDYCILGILVGVVLLDIPRVIKAWKELK